MKIFNTCKSNTVIPYNKLKNFQGELKDITDKNLDRLKKSIVNYGFTTPIFVWKNTDYILDGHQRLKAISSLVKDGWIIDEIPIDYIEAKDKEEAMVKLLHITSSYGIISNAGLVTFTDKLLIDDDIRLVNKELEYKIYDDIDGQYSEEKKDLKKIYKYIPFGTIDMNSENYTENLNIFLTQHNISGDPVFYDMLFHFFNAKKVINDMDDNIVNEVVDIYKSIDIVTDIVDANFVLTKKWKNEYNNLKDDTFLLLVIDKSTDIYKKSNKVSKDFGYLNEMIFYDGWGKYKTVMVYFKGANMNRIKELDIKSRRS